MSPQDRYDSLFQFFAAMYSVDWKLLKCQVRAESNFDPNVVSAAGAVGLAQFMSPTFTEWGVGHRINPEASIRAQARYMQWLLNQFAGDKALALASYNWGIGRVKRTFDKVPYDPELVPLETRNYVAKILAWLGEMA